MPRLIGGGLGRGGAGRAATALGAGFAALGLALAPAPASAQVLNKCQKEISKAIGKVASATQKFFQKCPDEYQKAVDKNVSKGLPPNDPTNIIAAAVKCETFLGDKVLSMSNASSAVKKNLDGLKSKVTKCGATAAEQDANLMQLGYPPQATHGDLWARLAIVAGLAAGFDAQMTSNLRTMTAMHGLFNVDGGTSCPSCGLFATTDGAGAPVPGHSGPCANVACDDSTGSSQDLQLATGGGSLPVSLAGTTVWKVCDFRSGFKTDGLVDGLKVIVAGPAKSLEANALGSAVCLAQHGSVGFINGPTGTQPGLDVHLCVDSDENADGDDCSADPLITGADASFCDNATMSGDLRCVGVTATPAAQNQGIWFNAISNVSQLTSGSCDNSGVGTNGPSLGPNVSTTGIVSAEIKDTNDGLGGTHDFSTDNTGDPAGSVSSSQLERGFIEGDFYSVTPVSDILNVSGNDAVVIAHSVCAAP